MIAFAAICPHPPLLLPGVGSAEDKKGVGKTLNTLSELSIRFAQKEIDRIIISSPHEDWGFDVPLHFLAQGFMGRIEKVLTGLEPPDFYFEKGKKLSKNTSYTIQDSQQRAALIASGDLSHCLKEDGPYGFHSDGPKFDEALINALKQKDTKTILDLDNKFPQAGECGLRSICFMLGMINELDWRADILSYEGPFGVGYLVAEFKF